MRWSTERKLTLALCAALVTLAVMSFTYSNSAMMSGKADQGVVNSTQVLAALSSTYSIIQDAETGQRGYLITGDEKYLRPYTLALRAYNDQLEVLRTLTAENPDHRARIASLDQKVHDKFAELDETIRIREQKGFEAAAAVVSVGRGKAIMEAIRKQIDQMTAHEQTLLVTRMQDARAVVYARWVRLIEVTGLEFLAAVIGFSLLNRYIHRNKQSEEEVRRLTEHLKQEASERKAILDLAPIGIAVAEDPQCKVIHANAAFSQMLRLPPDANVSKSEPPGARPENYRAMRDGRELRAEELPMQIVALTGRPLHNVEFDIVFGDGGAVNLLGSAAPLFGIDGKPRGAVGAFWNIAEIKRAQAELRESRELFRGAFVGSGIGMALVSIEGRWLKVNQALCGIVGYSESELLTKSFQEITHPEDLDVDLEFVRRMLAGEIKTYAMEKRYIHKNGSTVWIKLNGALVRNAAGEPQYFIAQVQDITAARRAREDLDRFFSLSQDIICVAGIDGYFKRINPAMRNILGYSESQLLSKPFNDFVVPEDREATAREVIKLGSGLSTIAFENRYIHADGSIRWISWKATPVASEGLIYATGRDVTEQRRAVESLNEAKIAAEAANKAKSAFLANMSHEIRTPLTAIFGFADLLLIPNLPPADRLESVQTIRRNGEHLLSVINDILDVSKIEAGKMQVEVVPASLATILADLGSLMRQRAIAKGLEFRIVPEGKLPEVIRTDPTRLRQILFNLVGNSIKFTERGSVTVSASLRHTPRGHMLAICVSDTGIGMTPAQQAQLFTPFTQSDPSHARKYGGTGLGLTISKRLTEMLDGDVSIRSEPGVGSAFTVTVAVGDLTGVRMLEHLGEAVVTRSPEAVVDGPKANGRILLAEDSRDNRRLIEFHLAKMGLTITHAENGRIARDKALASLSGGEQFDLILMDMQMPELDGYAATASLRIAGYSGPIIALTANAMEQDRDRCLAVGCDHFLSKPLQLDTFYKTVLFYLRRSHQPHGSSVSSRFLGSEQDVPRDPRLVPIVEEFLEDLRTKIDDISHALTQGNIKRVAWLAHQIKGVAGGVGYPAITSAAEELEAAVRTNKPAVHLTELVAKLVELCREATGVSP